MADARSVGLALGNGTAKVVGVTGAYLWKALCVTAESAGEVGAGYIDGVGTTVERFETTSIKLDAKWEERKARLAARRLEQQLAAPMQSVAA